MRAIDPFEPGHFLFFTVKNLHNVYARQMFLPEGVQHAGPLAQLPEGMEMVMPGDNVSLEVELITPVAMDKGLRFAIREGGRTVGAGTVAEIVE